MVLQEWDQSNTWLLVLPFSAGVNIASGIVLGIGEKIELKIHGICFTHPSENEP